jgi:hypothetical protein
MRGRLLVQAVRMPNPKHLQIDDLLFPVPVAAGMDQEKLVWWARKYRQTNEDRRPIEVTRIPGTRFYRIADGRHRTVASMMAGRRTVLAVIL